MGPSARTREGGTARTLAGSVRYDEIHYTRSRDRAYSSVNGASAEHAVYWSVWTFLSLRPSRFQPSSKHAAEGYLLPNESTAAVPVSARGQAGVAMAPDADLDARWAAWRARGLAHERAVRRKLTLVAGVAAIIATAVAIAYTLLRP